MIIFSELETGTLDLRLNFTAMRIVYQTSSLVLPFGKITFSITSLKAKAALNTRTKKSPFKRETFFYSYQVKLPTILRIIRLLGPTIGWGLVVSKLRSTFTSHKSMKQPILGRPLTPKH